MLATLLLYTYNHEHFIDAAVKSALDQTYSPLEVFVIDNHSPDATYPLITKRLEDYRGPHRIRYRQNPFNDLFNIVQDGVRDAKGEYIILMSGDDISEPERVSEVMRAFQETGACAMSSGMTEIDADGSYLGSYRHLDKYPEKPHTTVWDFLENKGSPACAGAGLAFHRDVFDFFGPRRPGPRNADVTLPFRGCLLSSNYYIDKPLVRRRLHSGNVSLVLENRPDKTEREQATLKEKKLGNRAANWIAMTRDLEFYLSKRKSHALEYDLLPKMKDHALKLCDRWVQYRESLVANDIWGF